MVCSSVLQVKLSLDIREVSLAKPNLHCLQLRVNGSPECVHQIVGYWIEMNVSLKN